MFLLFVESPIVISPRFVIVVSSLLVEFAKIPTLTFFMSSEVSVLACASSESLSLILPKFTNVPLLTTAP